MIPLMAGTPVSDPLVNLPLSSLDILEDFRICCLSREASLLARREVLTGKAKFGVSGDGKEVPQVALARAFRKGDFRSGYYRDQTFMLALELMSLDSYFAQLYADAHHDKLSGGRQMNCHFSTPLIDPTGEWLNHRDNHNVSADIAPTAGQMARGLGLALASKQYRENTALGNTPFSDAGNEVSVVTIGDASTSEGVFWETINAAVVQQVPLAVFVWDDGFGISVPKKFQTAKESISDALAGFEGPIGEGLAIHRLDGSNYPQLVTEIRNGIEKVRKHHQPAIFHVEGLTQPQGHSTSGSHERYKTPERLQWERENDCLLQMEQWLLHEGIATQEQITEIRQKAKAEAIAARNRAWKAYTTPGRALAAELEQFYQELSSSEDLKVAALHQDLRAYSHPQVHELVRNARQLHFHLQRTQHALASAVEDWLAPLRQEHLDLYSHHHYSEAADSALRVPVVAPSYSTESPEINGYQILNAFFDQVFTQHPNLYAFGEDVGHIGGVNQGFAKLQQKYGKDRIFDTGIREWTIMGQAIGMAMRGLRPIAEIQYLDYLLYGLEPLADDLATLRWRSNGTQKAPAIIRTRGHRLEGVWHSGSPMGMVLNTLRGMHVCVPRNCVQAAGMYNTLLQSGEPGLVVECLNGYRLKEQLPDNIGTYTVPLGAPEVVRAGTDLTLLTYGSCVRIAQAACELLSADGIEVELVDVQTLLPFDLEEHCVASLRKTNRLLVIDEDVPGGASAFILQQVLEQQKGYRYLDATPQTLTAKAHRPPYGSDGDYFSKPNVEDIYEQVMAMVVE